MQLYKTEAVDLQKCMLYKCIYNNSTIIPLIILMLYYHFKHCICLFIQYRSRKVCVLYGFQVWLIEMKANPDYNGENECQVECSQIVL